MGEVATRFVRRLAATGVESFTDVSLLDCERFVLAKTWRGDHPTPATQHFRRTTIRTLFRTLRSLGLPVADPTLDLVLPPRGVRPARPLTDDEIVLCRTAAAVRSRGQGRAAAALALAEATAHSSEIPQVHAADLDDPAHPTQVRLPGTRRADARIGHLTSWGGAILAGRAMEASGPLTYSGTAGAGTVSQQAATCNLIGELLHSAGLASEPDVRPASIRNWRARTAFDAGTPIQDVARMLGARSLDAAADAIGLDWRPR